MFALHPAFHTGARRILSLWLCEALLQLDARYPWVILVPRVEGAQELEDLAPDDRARLGDELVLAGRAVRAIGEAMGRPVAKLNIGLIGNITPQLHAHVVGRRPDDEAWPRPVWGAGEPRAFDRASEERACKVARGVLAPHAQDGSAR
jgi:diadenosine tetraphosphate (Ap4A) HIT family hydrolase